MFPSLFHPSTGERPAFTYLSSSFSILPCCALSSLSYRCPYVLMKAGKQKRWKWRIKNRIKQLPKGSCIKQTKTWAFFYCLLSYSYIMVKLYEADDDSDTKNCPFLSGHVIETVIQNSPFDATMPQGYPDDVLSGMIFLTGRQSSPASCIN